jgi:hypothetical protein
MPPPERTLTRWCGFARIRSGAARETRFRRATAPSPSTACGLRTMWITPAFWERHGVRKPLRPWVQLKPFDSVTRANGAYRDALPGLIALAVGASMSSVAT